MSNVAIIAKIPCQPGKRDEVAAGLRSMLDHVESEAGTLRYVLLEDSGDADTLWMYELYVDQAAVDAHGTSDAMKALGPAIGAHLAGRPEIHVCAPLGGKGL